MKNLIFKLMNATASVALMAVVFAADIPSVAGMNQPKEPANLKEVVKNHRA